MKKLRFAVFGTGFWSNYQIPAWLESPEVELVALCDKNLDRAIVMGKKFDVKKVYGEAEVLLDNEELDFIDIITDVDTHLKLTTMASERGLSVVCQKPMAPSFEDSKMLLATCATNNTKLFINENFRWQAPIRQVKAIMERGVIGKVFKGRISFCSAFPVFNNQPFLKRLDRFILTDVGSHILDVSRFLFGEAKTLYCLNKKVNRKIKGEDVANILMKMKNAIHCYVELSYASILEKEVFPQTLILVEGEKGSIYLSANYELKITTQDGTKSQIISPNFYNWIDPDYGIVHSSIVDAQMDIIKGLKGGKAETTGVDNFETVKLVWAAYHSVENDCLVELKNFK